MDGDSLTDIVREEEKAKGRLQVYLARLPAENVTPSIRCDVLDELRELATVQTPQTKPNRPKKPTDNSNVPVPSKP